MPCASLSRRSCEPLTTAPVEWQLKQLATSLGVIKRPTASVNDGGTTLIISDDVNLGDVAGGLTLTPGTTLELFFGEVPAYTISHSITVSGNAELRADDGVTATFDGVIAGSGGISIGNPFLSGGGEIGRAHV